MLLQCSTDLSVKADEWLHVTHVICFIFESFRWHGNYSDAGQNLKTRNL